MRLPERIFATSLRLFPRWFRELYGEDMRRDFVARSEAIGRSIGRRARWAYQLRATGVVPWQAISVRRRARGPSRRTDDSTREGGGGEMSDRRGRLSKLHDAVAELTHDARHAARFLRRHPGFSLVAIVTLALGIGATTAIFSLLDAALLRRPGVQDPSSLVAVYTTCRSGEPRCSSSFPDYLDYRDRTDLLTDLAAETGIEASLGDEDRGSRIVRLRAVTGNYFPLLGVGASLGRVLQPADDIDGAVPVVVLSYDFWRSYFGSDAAVVGSTVRLSGLPHQVVGVASEGYDGLSLDDSNDMWLALRPAGALMFGVTGNREGFAPTPTTVWQTRNSRWIARLVGRLAPGATSSQARAELSALSDFMAQESPMERGPRTVTLDPLGRMLAPIGAEESLPRFLWLLGGVVVTTLLLASASLANLLLARATSRTAEMGLRVAIGAGRRRLVRQLFAESLVLAGAGATAGLVLAAALLGLLGTFELPGGTLISALDTGMDLRVLLVTLGLTGLTAVLCGLAPALRVTRPDVVETLKSSRSPQAARGTGRLRRGLVALQLALCVVLLVGSGLFIRTVRGAFAADLGFGTDDVGVAFVNLSLLGYSREEGDAFGEELLRRISARPDVRAVAAGSNLPMAGGAGRGTFARVDGYEPAPDEEMRIDMVGVTPDYFDVLDIPLLAGRTFTEADRAGAENVAIVSRVMAERYWADGDAVGGVVRFQTARNATSTVRVVGVVDDVHWDALEEEPTNFVFMPSGQTAFPLFSSFAGLVVRSVGDPEPVLGVLRAEARSLEPELTLTAVRSMDQVMGDLLMPQRMGAALLSGFGALALLLATVGIAGVVSYAVGEQRRAIGVRRALGARRGEILMLVTRGMAGPVALGLGVGLVVALLLDDAAATFLYGVRPGDPATYVVIALGLLAASLVATLLPARAAAAVDPMEVLRSE